MKKPVNMGLAVAIASGRSIKAWAAENGVPPATAYRMSRSKECRDVVTEIRRRSKDRAIGILSKHLVAAAGEIGKLVSKAAAETTRLAASRAVIADLLTLEGDATIHAALSELDRRMAAQEAARANGGSY